MGIVTPLMSTHEKDTKKEKKTLHVIMKTSFQKLKMTSINYV